VKEYVSSDAEVIITSCPGCILQLSKGCKDKPVVHLIEVLEEALAQTPAGRLT
jgi:Fe-S oxidoreductase